MVAKIKLQKKSCIQESGDFLVCEVDDQMNPLGGTAQAVWTAAGPKLIEYRKKVTLPLPEGSLLTTPSFDLSRFKEIVHIVMPNVVNPSALTREDRSKLKNCYDSLLSNVAASRKSKIVLPFLGVDRSDNNISATDAVDIAFDSAFEARRNVAMIFVKEIYFAASVPSVYDYAQTTGLYRGRKDKENPEPRTRPCSIATLGKSNDALLVRTAQCEGEHVSLLSVNDHEVPDLFGCEHEADMIMSRIGNFDVDWNCDEAAQYKICKRHLRIFLHDWRNVNWMHFRLRDGNIVCSFPDHQGPVTTLRTDRTYHVSKADCKQWMEKKKTLLRVGTPICKVDFEHLRESKQVKEEEYIPRTRTPTTPRTPTTASRDVEKAVNSLLAAVNRRSSVHRNKDFSNLQDRQEREKVRMIRNALHAICEVVAPEAKEDLMDKIIKGERITPVDTCAKIKKMLTDAADLYERSESKLHRLFILSSVASFPLPLLQQYFNGLTDYYHKKARNLNVRGTVEDLKNIIRVRYDEKKLDKLIEFILSPLVALNLPFDERKEKMDDGSKMSMPNLQRLQTVDEVYRMYLIWLEEEGITEMALHATTAKYIIKLVAPTRRKNLTCVDEKIADGMKAFDELFSAVTVLLKTGFINKQTADNLTKHLQSGKAYLRGDFKVHVKNLSNCADHCATFALSDPTSPNCFAAQCDHVHDVTCGRCADLEATLNLMEQLLVDAETNARTELEREQFSILNEECTINCAAINEMKKHQIRASISHFEKMEYVNSLKSGQAIVTLDWAQKLSPFYGREKQSEYYAKSGIAYHISHAETVIDGKSAEHLSVHMFKPGEKQDGTAVFLVINSFLLELRKMGINNVLIRSDCAGCYRNAPLICSLFYLQKEIKMKIDGLLFSEAQAGKGPCDRGSARMKGKARDHVTTTRGKIETAEEFYNATAASGKLLNGVSIHRCTISNKKDSTSKIKNITSYTSFEFEDGGIRLRRHRSIGIGQLFNPSKVTQCQGKLKTLQSGGHTTKEKPLFWLTPTSHQARTTKPPTTDKKEDSSGMLHCMEEGCIKEFRSFHQLERHTVSGKHEYEIQRKTIHDYCVEMASLSLGARTTTTTTSVESMVNNAVHSGPTKLKQGWALREAKKRNVKDKPARELIRQFFADKRQKNMKVNAHEAEVFMKNARNEDGQLLIRPRNRLTVTQIKSIINGLLDKEEEPSSSTPKKKKPNTPPNASLNNSLDEEVEEEEEEEEEIPEDFSDDDDEEFVRDLIIEHRNEIFDQEENPSERKRKSKGK